MNFFLTQYYFIKGIEIYFEEFFRPLQMGFYKSKDNGATYERWQFYVTSDSSQNEPSEQCSEKFNMTLGNKPAFVNDIICEKYPNETMKKKDDIVSIKKACVLYPLILKTHQIMQSIICTNKYLWGQSPKQNISLS